MNIGHRIFLIDGNLVSKVSQKTFNALFFRREHAFPEFAGQTKQFAIAMYTLENRKPKQIVRIDCHRLRIGDEGGLDEAHLMRSIHLSFKRHESVARTTSPSGNVIDAVSQFDEKAWRHLHPELSGPALRQILDSIF
jgi:hypothetical protein